MNDLPIEEKLRLTESLVKDLEVLDELHRKNATKSNSIIRTLTGIKESYEEIVKAKDVKISDLEDGSLQVMNVQYRIKSGKMRLVRTIEIDLTELLEETIAEGLDIQVEAIEVIRMQPTE